MTEAWQWEDPRRVLARHGLVAKKRFSQNFLVARSVIERIVGALALRPEETVVELGAGLGTLTGALLATGARVVAVDLDRDMLEVLRAELGTRPRLAIVAADATEVDLHALGAEAGGRVAVTGNLPYSATGAILRHLCASHASVGRAVLMVQREVRDRLLAEPGTRAWGALTVFTRNVYEVRSVCLVPAGAFHPAPRVQSAVFSLTPRSSPVARESPAFVAIVRGCFEARRKTLRNSLLLALDDAARIDSVLAEVGIDGRRRGETLAIEELDALARAWERGDASPPRPE